MDFSTAAPFWWVFPVSVAIASVALSTGISGALFFSPFFLLVVGLAPAQAIGAGLMTEVFGSAFGTASYIRQKVVDFTTAKYLLAAAVPAGMVGAWLAHIVDASVLQLVFGGALILLAAIMLWVTLRRRADSGVGTTYDEAARETVISARDGHEYRYRVCNRVIGVPLAGLGAGLTGLMSAGLPEITTTQLILRCRIPPRVAVATSITVLTVTVFFAAGIHALAGGAAWHIVVWSVPGVIVGAQIGPRLQGKVPSRIAERVMAVIFLAVGVLVIVLQIA